ncbi:PKD domain-containing protein [Microbacterium sp. BK668]|uniref:PKD domain-containing protein n=1 Tax=Microbacterium sp. BK668 TaxID=2512118 RepID=UPI001060C8AC|nr:PKD domain-containing protein [Microbacterium sp. BK668]TDN93247.1 PKD domain-containing protein [Microbacterium sp. BK668]
MRTSRKFRALVAAAAAALVLSLLGPAWAASAVPTPIQPRPPSAVTADRLPTVQINGVVWSQAVVGNTVYAGGSFTQARPAGAAPGTNQTARNNLLSYDITTGNLNTAFAPNLNGQVRGVAASPDGSRIYVVGDFTMANGQVRSRIAAYSTATGALISSFSPVGVTSSARTVVATDTAVYVGGGFAGAGSTPRNNLAAFSAADGSLLPWNPNADYTVWALAVSGDQTAVFAGGSFQNVGGQSAYGLAKISASTGALDTGWQLARVTSPPSPRNAGPNAGWTSLRVSGDHLYGTGWVFGSGGNLEGIFKASVANPGTLQWVMDCHGDTYDSFLSNGIVYGAGHSHYCGNMGDGAPQFEQWRYQYALAWNDTQTGDILNDPLNYTNWRGRQGPALVNWNPDFTLGTYTQQYQAAWSVAGNADYIVFGGEFPTVNGVGQQGLVRFARKPIAPAREGPRFVNGTLVPTLVPVSTTALRVSWPAGFDRDDYALNYRITRNGATVRTSTANSNWWTLPAHGFIDTGLSPGQTYTYQVVVSDGDGNTVFGANTAVTMPTSFPAANTYSALVRSLGARIYWPLNEKSGLVATDRAASPTSPPNLGVTDGRADNGVTWNQAGAITGDTAASLGDNDFSRIYTGSCPATASCSLSTETAPDTFTAQVWIKTTTTRGGRILGFGDLQNGVSDHHDRHIYMDNSGRLIFGVRDEAGVARIVTSPATYRDNQWHLVTATMSAQGMVLYVDGAAVAQRTDTTRGERYLGYWRLGGDALTGSALIGWPSAPSTPNFIGSVDEVAIYPTALTASNVQALYAARAGGGPVPNQPPQAAFTSSTNGLTASFDASGSTDPDGSIASYAWTFGDGTTGTERTTSRTYQNPGTYSVTLTVTDNAGATATRTQPVTVAAASVIASDAFDRTVSNGWGSADVGGAWALSGSLSDFAVGAGSGTLRMAAGSGPSAYLGSVSAADSEMLVSFGYDKPGSGGGIYTSFVARRIGTSDYRAKLQITATGTALSLVRTVNGAETALASQPLAGFVYAPGAVWNLRLRVTGTGPTTLQARVWAEGTAEPTTWTTATDSTAALQAAGAVGVYSYLSGSANNAPITLGVRDLRVNAP